MGIKYSQIAEMIETGNTADEGARKEILRRHQISLHKRKTVPIYEFDRKNYLENL